MIPLSVLDLAPILQGQSIAQTFENSLDLARHAERLNYKRYWVAEHHNIPSIASAATAVVIGYIAGGTKTIRVGSGGIMLPNHAPLVIAEQFGTLASLFPDRIDLGLGRAPGTDQATARALRRDFGDVDETFPRDVLELQTYLSAPSLGQTLRAIPGAGTNVPIWLLGSSLFSAQLAAALGLPFAFASHFAPQLLLQALQIYRRTFVPSPTLQEPYAMAGITIVAADTDDEARRLFTSHQQSFVNLRRGRPAPMAPPLDTMEGFWTPAEREMVESTMTYAIAGGPETVRRRLQAFVELTGVDELIVMGQTYDHAARRRSFEIVAEAALTEPAGRPSP
ncbi:MAG TPA: LLM class flavin-dependent oxidoreductase [Candidatus Acidoferrales bacterium]|nr:LLM class flavin-dependent oxidoreductase [Candidatus Acidoferrales bacterium]